MNWKKLDSQVLIEEWFFKLEKLRYERLADNRIIDPYYLLRCNNWVNGLAITEDGQAIMLQQYRPGIEQVILELPGGVMDPGETDPEQAMRRELLEETGYVFDKVELLCSTAPNPALQDNWCHAFLATGGKLIQEQSLDDNEEIQVELMSLETLKQLLDDNEIAQTIHVTTLYYAFRKLGI
jgi:ADP-ribose pyrophosphatase